MPYLSAKVWSLVCLFFRNFFDGLIWSNLCNDFFNQYKAPDSPIRFKSDSTATTNTNWQLKLRVAKIYKKYLYIIYIHFSCRKMPKSPHTQLSSRDLFIRINTTVNIRLFGGDLGIVKYDVIVIIWTFFVLKALTCLKSRPKALFCRK